MDSRSQHQNKKIAEERLLEKVTLCNTESLKESISDQWENHLNLQRGNPIKVFRGIDFKKEKKEKSYKTNRSHLKNDLRNQLKE
jgi:peptide chain release factor